MGTTITDFCALKDVIFLVLIDCTDTLRISKRFEEVQNNRQKSLVRINPEKILCQRLIRTEENLDLVRSLAQFIQQKLHTLIVYSTESLIHTHKDTAIMKAQKVKEMHILRYQLLDTKHWQSTLGTKSFAELHLSSSVILSYCCVSIHEHL